MDDYEKIAVVGRGAHGVCWLCRRKDDVFRQTVIVKTVSLDGLTTEEETAIMGELSSQLWGFHINKSEVFNFRLRFRNGEELLKQIPLYMFSKSAVGRRVTACGIWSRRSWSYQGMWECGVHVGCAPLWDFPWCPLNLKRVIDIQRRRKFARVVSFSYINQTIKNDESFVEDLYDRLHPLNNGMSVVFC